MSGLKSTDTTVYVTRNTSTGEKLMLTGGEETWGF